MSNRTGHLDSESVSLMGANKERAPHATAVAAGTTQTSFPAKLYDILQQNEKKHGNKGVFWSPDGCFIYFQPKVFNQQESKHFFQGTSYSSFSRRLYRFQFDRILDEGAVHPDGVHVYHNANFQQGQRDRLRLIEMNNKRVYCRAIRNRQATNSRRTVEKVPHGSSSCSSTSFSNDSTILNITSEGPANAITAHSSTTFLPYFLPGSGSIPSPLPEAGKVQGSHWQAAGDCLQQPGALLLSRQLIQRPAPALPPTLVAHHNTSVAPSLPEQRTSAPNIDHLLVSLQLRQQEVYAALAQEALFREIQRY